MVGLRNSKGQGVGFYLLPFFLFVFVLGGVSSCRVHEKRQELRVGVVDYVQLYIPAQQEIATIGPFSTAINELRREKVWTERYWEAKDNGRKIVCGEMKKLNKKINMEKLIDSLNTAAKRSFYITGHNGFVFSRLRFEKGSSECPLKVLFPSYISPLEVMAILKRRAFVISQEKKKRLFVIDHLNSAEVVLKRNPLAEQKNNFSQIFLKAYPRPEKAFAALLNGDVDLAFPVPYFLYSAYKSVSGLEFKLYNIENFVYIIAFNHKHLGTGENDVLHKVLDLAADRERINRDVFGGLANLEGFWPWRYDPVEAMKMLDEHGWHYAPHSSIREKNGKKLMLKAAFPEWWPEGRRILFLLKRDFYRIGIGLDVKSISFEEMRKIFVEQKDDFDLVFIMGVVGYPHTPLALWCRKLAGRFNPFAYDDPDFCRASAKGDAEGVIRAALKNPPFVFIAEAPVVVAADELLEIPRESYLFENIQQWRFRH